VFFLLWKISTTQLIHEFIDIGFKTIITCVNEKYLDKSFAGRMIDKEFLNGLPAAWIPAARMVSFTLLFLTGQFFKNLLHLKKEKLFIENIRRRKKVIHHLIPILTPLLITVFGIVIYYPWKYELLFS